MNKGGNRFYREKPHTDLGGEPDVADVAPGRYRHFKGGIVEVLGTALHTERADKFVVYREIPTGDLFARPLSMWSETVTKEVPRFELIQEERKAEERCTVCGGRHSTADCVTVGHGAG